MSEDTTQDAPPRGGEPPVRYGLAVPFACVASKGGPYDDAAYSAGWEMGTLWGVLETARPARHQTTVRTASLPDVDQVALFHGYDCVTQDTTALGEWTHVDLVRVGPGDGALMARSHLSVVRDDADGGSP